jgi:hypothetical protein
MRLVAALLMACTFASPAVAATAPQPTPQRLWNAYPLEPTPAPELVPLSFPQETAVDPDGGSPTAALFVALLTATALTLLASAAFAVHRIRAAAAEVVDDVPRERPAVLSPRARRVIEYTQAPAPLPKVAAAGWERCTIEWWRGYVKSDFYALATQPDGRQRVAGRSNLFRWHGEEPPPESDATEKSLRLLVEALEDDGWEHDGRGELWYELSFKRPV